MTPPPILVASRDAEAGRLIPALESAGFAVTRLDPARTDPGRVASLSPHVLILETGPSDPPERILDFWQDPEMDVHLPILLLHPPGQIPLPLGQLDEPLDGVAIPSDPREVVARVQGLLLARRIRVYRRNFHDVSQPVTVARALAQKALKLVSPGDPAHPTVVQLDLQVERIFRIIENLQRKRTG